PGSSDPPNRSAFPSGDSADAAPYRAEIPGLASLSQALPSHPHASPEGFGHGIPSSTTIFLPSHIALANARRPGPDLLTCVHLPPVSDQASPSGVPRAPGPALELNPEPPKMKSDESIGSHVAAGLPRPGGVGSRSTRDHVLPSQAHTSPKYLTLYERPPKSRILFPAVTMTGPSRSPGESVFGLTMVQSIPSQVQVSDAAMPSFRSWTKPP